MAQILTDDDEDLELEDEDKKNPPIGKLSRPNPSSTPLPADMPPPDVGAASTPSASTISEAAPFTRTNPDVPAPRPAGQAFSDWQAQDLAKHPVGQPRYHGLARAADTIAGVTKIGQLAEVGGEMGTLGAEAKENRLARGAALENRGIREGEQERQANAQIEREQEQTAAEQIGSELVDVKLPDGTTTQVMRKNLASPTTAIIAGQSRENVAGTNAGTRENVAQINAGAKEDTAKIMVGGRAMGTKNIQGPDGKAHVMMWNPSTHTYDRDLGEAPASASASSAYANTRTTNLIDPETGVPTTYQYNPQTGTYDKPLGASATGAYGHEMAQAGAVQRAGGQLIQDIKTHQADLGTLQTWVEKYGLNTPIANPELARLQAELSTFAALQPAMHGFRSRSALEAFHTIIGGLQKNPEATIASIEGILQTAGNIRGKGSPSAPAGAGSAPGGGAGNPPSGPQRFEDWQRSQSGQR